MNVVPTKATAKLARHMVAEAIKQESGAEAVIIHYDDVDPEQIPALVGLLLDAGIREAIRERSDKPTKHHSRPCEDCGEMSAGLVKGACHRCYAARSRLAAGMKVRPKKPLARECESCGQVRRIAAKDKCATCARRAQRVAQREREQAA